MTATPDMILALNAGSSSLKFALFKQDDAGKLLPVCKGKMGDIGGTQPHFTVKNTAGRLLHDQSWPDAVPDFQILIQALLSWMEGFYGTGRLRAVGHRVVHGGTDFTQPVLITPDILSAIDALTPLAPLHQPYNILPMRMIAALDPQVPQIACFDTAFHQTIPQTASRYALPPEFEAKGIRKYGFHGLSYEYIAGYMGKTMPDLAEKRVIVAHLGSGASLCALRQGRSLDTTMGFSVLDGLMMATRCGNLDPGVILYLQQHLGFSPQQIEDLLYHQSGLLGVSGGMSADMQCLLAGTETKAVEAIDLFIFRTVREIGALAASLGGLDGLIFTAGIGENSPRIRSMICARLNWLGIELDETQNTRNESRIHRQESSLPVQIIPTDEEATIAHHVLATS